MSDRNSTTLGDIAEIISGSTPKSNVNDYWDGDIAWATPTDLSKLENKEILTTARLLTQQGLESCSARILPPDSVLFTSRAPIGHIAINKIPMATNQGFKSFIPDTSKVDPNYLYYWLKEKKTYIQHLGRGATFKEVSKQIVASITITLPPLEEQRRIAKISDKSNQIKKLFNKKSLLLQNLRKSIFFNFFGNPITNPYKWEEGPISSFTSCIVPGRDKPKSFSGNIPWITTDELPNNFKISNSSKKIGLTLNEIEEVRAKIIPKNSVIMSCVGNLGLTSITRKEVVMNQQLHSYQCSEDILPEFLATYLPFRKPWMKAKASQTTLPYLNKGKCNAIPIFLPPLEVQKEFVQVLNHILLQEEIISQINKKIFHLNNSISQELLGT